MKLLDSSMPTTYGVGGFDRELRGSVICFNIVPAESSGPAWREGVTCGTVSSVLFECLH